MVSKEANKITGQARKRRVVVVVRWGVRRGERNDVEDVDQRDVAQRGESTAERV